MSDNCPFCEPRTSWGMSPEAWNSMREWHEKGHPEVKLKVNDVVEIDPESDNTVPSNPPLETEPSLRKDITRIIERELPIFDHPDLHKATRTTVNQILKAIEDSIGEEFDYGDKLTRKALSIEFMGGYNQAIRDVKAKLRGDR